LTNGVNIWAFGYCNSFAATPLGEFEILWLPVIAITVALPVVAFIFWTKEKFNVRSFYLYAILIIAAAVALMQLKLL
jgi:hypothetical protein